MIKLFDYQRKSIDDAYFNSITNNHYGNTIFDFDMGYGKTVCALAYHQKYFRDKQILVIAPASVRDAKVWQKEFERFIGEGEIKVESYAKLAQLKDTKNTFIIFDECHALKNPVSGRSKHAQKIAQEPTNRFVGLSGTTHPNGWYDIAGYFVLFGISKNKTEFYRHYVEQRPARYGKFMEIVGYKRIPQLKKEWKGISIRRDLEGVRELPEQIFYNVFCETKVDPRASDGKLRKQFGVSFENIPQKMAYLTENAVQDAEKQLLALLEQGQDMVIFYRLNAELEKIKATIRKYNPKAKIAFVNGKQHDNTDGANYVVAQYTAGSQGLNLQEFRYTVFFAPTYSWQDYVQAVARTYRTGQTEKTVFYRFYGGIYDDIWAAIEQKQDFNFRAFLATKGEIC